MSDIKGSVFDIQRYSIHDGPGIRTVIFLKGCPLSCKWCSNPESQKCCSELFYIRSKCIICGECIKACPNNAIEINKSIAGITIDRQKCKSCFYCTAICPSSALLKKGTLMTIDEVLLEALKDRVFFEKSDGGITISGGEPFFQADFLIALLHAFKQRYVNTAIETTGLASWSKWMEALPYIDTILYDLKHVEDKKHKTYTGTTNQLIKGNLIRLLKMNIDITVRIPIIPGFNDDEESIDSMIQFLKENKAVKVELLKYHQLGSSKYISLDKENDYKGKVPLGEATFNNIKARFDDMWGRI